ncbi:MAG: metal-sensing transcriptional repressor [candidate division NC10 bacterium]|nr:metal-sensing transcriptional repressor [candidate division NC10 bacterium]
MKKSLHTQTRQIVNRLARIEGHVAAVRGMVERGRSCPDVLTQLAAVRAALDQVGRLVLSDHLAHCVVDAAQRGDARRTLADLEAALERYFR